MYILTKQIEDGNPTRNPNMSHNSTSRLYILPENVAVKKKHVTLDVLPIWFSDDAIKTLSSPRFTLICSFADESMLFLEV